MNWWDVALQFFEVSALVVLLVCKNMRRKAIKQSNKAGWCSPVARITYKQHFTALSCRHLLAICCANFFLYTTIHTSHFPKKPINKTRVAKKSNTSCEDHNSQFSDGCPTHFTGDLVRPKGQAHQDGSNDTPQPFKLTAIHCGLKA